MESYFAILKRGVYGTFHHISEAHLHRYLAEFDFRYSNREKVGVDDTGRAELAVMGAKGSASPTQRLVTQGRLRPGSLPPRRRRGTGGRRSKGRRARNPNKNKGRGSIP